MDETVKFCDLSAMNRPYEEELLRRMAHIYRNGIFIGGEAVSNFEDKLSRLSHTSYAVGTGNGYDSLFLIFKAMLSIGYLQKGDKVLVPANTFIATVLAVVNAGLEPVPVDVDESTSLMTCATLERAWNESVKAVVPVHLYGRACWSEEIKDFCEKRRLFVVEDNAQAIGAIAEVNGLLSESCATGSLGHAAAFSFYPTKNIGALGDGGAVTTDIPEIAEQVRALGNYGGEKREEKGLLGCNSRLDTIQAAVLDYKLGLLDKIISCRRKNARRLSQGIQSEFVDLPKFVPNDESMVWHQYVIRLKGCDRHDFRKYMLEKGIETDVHYPVLAFDQPCFRSRYSGTTRGFKARELCDVIVSLPVNESLKVEEIDRIIETINSYKPTLSN